MYHHFCIHSSVEGHLGSFHPSGQFPAALAMAGGLHLEEAVTAIYPFSAAIHAFEEKATGRHAKVMLRFLPPEELERRERGSIRPSNAAEGME